MRQSLKHHLEHGIPYSDIDTSVHTPELDSAMQHAVWLGVQAHSGLQNEYDNLWSRQVHLSTEDDPFSGEKSKYIVPKDGNGELLYRQWDSGNPATDIGIRMINPGFSGRANRNTILHADSEAEREFRKITTPAYIFDAMMALAALNKLVVARIAIPFLHRVAEIDGIPKDEYRNHFFPPNKRAHTLTRCIMYHTVTGNTLTPQGSDGAPLLIKEHCDQSSFTIDVHQTSSGLQYNIGGDWVDAGTEPAVFRGAAEDFRQQSTKPALHRVVETIENQYLSPEWMRNAGIGRVSLVTFIGPSDSDSRVVQPSSSQTHPTQHVAA